MPVKRVARGHVHAPLPTTTCSHASLIPRFGKLLVPFPCRWLHGCYRIVRNRCCGGFALCPYSRIGGEVVDALDGTKLCVLAPYFRQAVLPRVSKVSDEEVATVLGF